MKGLRMMMLVSAVFCGLAAVGRSEAPRSLLRTSPEVTVRFPGGYYHRASERDGLVVTCSDWSREDTAAVFDFSDPSKPKFLARFPAKGYSCGEPVFFGNRCYVPNGFCATVIDLADRSHPKFAGYLNPQFPKNGCSRLWVEDGELYFAAFDGCYRVKADGMSFEKADRTPPKGKSAGAGPVTFRDAVVRFGEAEVPFVHSLSAVAVRSGKAYVYTSQGGTAQLLPLDTDKAGLTLFGPRHSAATLPRGRGYNTMGMQTALCVTRVGDLVFTDDGIVRFGRAGKLETILERTRPASNSSVDGTRIALAQCTRCRVIDFSNPNDVKVLDVAPPTELPIHITGCHLRDNDLYLAYTLVEDKRQDFVYRFPSKGYVTHVDLRRPTEFSPALETPPCIALDRVGDWLYVTCRKGSLAVVDARNPEKLALSVVRRDILDGDGYKVKTFDGRTFVLNGRRVAELDVADPSAPRVRHLYDRGDGVEAPGYDDFTVDGGKLYALAHASLDVFGLDDARRTREVADDCGTNGILREPLAEADGAVFEGHVANVRPPDGVVFRAGRFGNCFGAFVTDWAKLPDGRYAVAYGEAGVVLCDGRGDFVAELPRSADGGAAVFATEVVWRDGKLFVRNDAGKVFAVGLGMMAAADAAKEPNISVFAKFIRMTAKERGVSLSAAADMLYALGVRGYDCGPDETDLDELAKTKLKPINFYYFPDWFARGGKYYADRATPAECLALAKRYGIPRVMVVPPDFTDGRENAAEFERMVALMREFVAAAKRDGITVTVETFGGTDNPCSYAKYLKRFMEEIPDIRFALDTGNLYYAGRGEDILEMAEYAKGRIGHVHLKDQRADANRVYVTLGEGAVPNEKIVKAVNAAGYDGWYTLENPVGDTYQDTARQVAVLKTWLAGD